MARTGRGGGRGAKAGRGHGRKKSEATGLVPVSSWETTSSHSASTVSQRMETSYERPVRQ
jgi:hypothetical protein